MKIRINFLILTAFLCLTLAACAGDGKEEFLPDAPVEELYNKGLEMMDEGSFKEAAKQFEEVERQHPYSQWSTRAELMGAYAQYEAMDYDAATTALDQFIQIHPGNANIAYAYYLRALCSYERIADVKRDQTYAMNSLKSLQEIISRFPDTTYAKDAVLKTALVNDHLAGGEMEVGRYYQKQKIYTAAVGRFRTVVEKYQTTSHAPEALHRLVECYLTLGITNEARTAAAVLGHNFPGSKWYEDSYKLLAEKNLTPKEDKESWIYKAWDAIF
ncbi:MAG: outer membrane protein assembly factor BamD [Alphaproteobacteria bacterium]|nr:outer membrane protein assembly factor BamD [Alphaproteobacteria bacterium]